MQYHISHKAHISVRISRVSRTYLVTPPSYLEEDDGPPRVRDGQVADARAVAAMVSIAMVRVGGWGGEVGGPSGLGKESGAEGARVCVCACA